MNDEQKRQYFRDYNKKYYAKNREKLLRYQVKYKNENKEKIKAYKLKNKEHLKICLKQWRLNNKEHLREYYLKNRERIFKHTNRWRQSHREISNSYVQKYRTKNKQKIFISRKIYLKEHPWITTLNSIRQRCSNPNVDRYKRYGGRGIKCLITANELKFLWHRDNASLMKKASIDRIDNDGNYCLENCRYIELSENSRRSALKKAA